MLFSPDRFIGAARQALTKLGVRWELTDWERAYNEGEPLTRDDMREIGKPWQPFSTVATWYLWRSLENT